MEWDVYDLVPKNLEFFIKIVKGPRNLGFYSNCV